jgi:L-lactate permease
VHPEDLQAVIRLAYLSADPTYISACCISGLLEALTPLSIITGAIMLFEVRAPGIT